MDYQTIKAMAKEQDGISIGDLCALAPNNDPFYTGRKSEVAAAEWFAELWNRFGYARGVYLRRVHYQVVSQDPPVLRPNGEPYQNTLNDWGYLCNAGKYARYLSLVDCGAFEDRRNPDAKLFTNWHNPGDTWYDDPEPGYDVEGDPDEWDNYTLPDLPKLARLSSWLPDPPGYEVSGYGGVQQEYHLEVWCEKSTMNDVLKPLCQRYAVNLVTGLGEMSITSVVDFLRRVREADRPARILYVSDYDPAGLGMPISVARKIEFFQRNEGDDDLDVRLQPVILTADQVAEYDLPRVPVKDSDLRKTTWEAHHGKGQVELDALEALHPGELKRIIEAVILVYYDPTLESRAERQRRELARALDSERQEVLDLFEAEREQLEADYDALRADFDRVRQRFDELVEPFQAEVEAYHERLENIVKRGHELHDQIVSGLDDVNVDTNDYPLPEPDLPAEADGLLYDSRRDYLGQLASYKAHKNGGGL